MLFEQDINGSQVHVKQLAKQKILTEVESQAIYSALEEIRSEIKQGQYSFTERDERTYICLLSNC
ncbi:hypothetical protein PGH46_00120 [Legionella pneumophila]|nr:hypothetical protein PGH46_00120 [Legionella pneumophila]